MSPDSLPFLAPNVHWFSFTKGCYVGQELMARTHFKGMVRKRLMPFQLLPEQKGATSAGLQPGQRVLLPSHQGSGAAVGTVRVVSVDAGLAVLRLGKALPAVEAGGPLHVETESGTQLAIRAWRPEWWPPGWGREEGAAAAAAGD